MISEFEQFKNSMQSPCGQQAANAALAVLLRGLAGDYRKMADLCDELANAHDLLAKGDLAEK
jgi:hypothetical protein